MENKNHQAIEKVNNAMRSAAQDFNSFDRAAQTMRKASITLLEFGLQMDKFLVSQNKLMREHLKVLKSKS